MYRFIVPLVFGVRWKPRLENRPHDDGRPRPLTLRFDVMSILVPDGRGRMPAHLHVTLLILSLRT